MGLHFTSFYSEKNQVRHRGDGTVPDFPEFFFVNSAFKVVLILFEQFTMYNISQIIKMDCLK